MKAFILIFVIIIEAFLVIVPEYVRSKTGMKVKHKKTWLFLVSVLALAIGVMLAACIS
ncbi:hypothetical protein JOD45_000759 [Scopulibacillus daqui]|uniref:Uncharacterized protein n=1 Tax=Scopulibacillus daqui TaxID=1469162 RepID=A0ABS2PWZ8_9BACL|nr:hypothetical protein [Scopulibacillus daqui]